MIPRQDLFYSVYNNDDDGDDDYDGEKAVVIFFISYAKCESILIYVEKRMLLCGIISTKGHLD